MKYGAILVVVILSGYVFMNPGMLSIQDSSMVPTQTYSGDLDVSTTYYVTSGGGGSGGYISGNGGVAYSGAGGGALSWSDDDDLSHSPQQAFDRDMINGAGGSGVLDDIKIYNYEISKEELNYLYTSGTTEWEWNSDGSKMYLEGSTYYSCYTDYDVSTCTKNGYKWDTTNIPDNVVITDVTELEEPLATNIWDYLFK